MNKTLLTLVLIAVYSGLSLNTYAQTVQGTSVTQNTTIATECDPIKFTVGIYIGCINWTYNGLSSTIVGNDLFIDINVTDSRICAGAIRNITDTINVTNVPTGTYNIKVRSLQTGTVVHTLNGSSMNVVACCATKADFSPNFNSFCIGDTVKMNNISASSGQKWYKNGVEVDTVRNYTEILTTPGSYTYKLVADSACGKDSISKNIRVLADPNLGNDTTICFGDMQTLQLSLWSSYLWSDASTKSSRQVSQAGVYSVAVNAASGCERKDSIEISVLGPELEIGADTSICAGSSFILDAGTNVWTTISWNTGDTTSQLTVNGAGIFSVNVENALGCQYSDIILIRLDVDSVLKISGQTVICDGDSALFEADPIFKSFQWFDNDTARVKSFAIAGTYAVTATSQFGCKVSASKSLQLNALPNVSIGGDTVLCNGTDWTIDAKTPGASSYRWQNATRDDNFLVILAVKFYVAVTDTNGCIGSDTVNVSYKDCIPDEPNDTTSIQPLNIQLANEILAYPNPVNKEVVLQGTSTLKIQNVEVIDLVGRSVIIESHNDLSEVSVDMTGLETGRYLIKIETSAGLVVKPVIKN